MLSPGKAVIWAAFFNFVAAFAFGTAVAKTVGVGHDRHHDRHLRGDLRGPDRRDRLGPDHLVLRPADQLVARADRRLRRRGGRQGRLRRDHPVAAGPRRSSSSSCRRSSAWCSGFVADDRPSSGSSAGTPPSRVDRWFRRLQLRLGGRSSAWATAPTTRRRRWASSPACCSPPATSTTFYDPVLGDPRGARRDRLGTLTGGWRIIHTMGSKITKLQPVGGFAAETARRDRALHRDAPRRPGQHDAHDHRRDRRRRRDPAPVGRALGRRRADRLGLDPDDSRLGAHRRGRLLGRRPRRSRPESRITDLFTDADHADLFGTRRGSSGTSRDLHHGRINGTRISRILTGRTHDFNPLRGGPESETCIPQPENCVIRVP